MNKIHLNHNSVCYVLCPAYFKTGGTELLHQYVFIARKKGINCHIVYPFATSDKNINPAFFKYLTDYLVIDDILDSIENVLIVPEIYTGFLPRFKNLRKVVWWESVDNYLKLSSLRYNLGQLFTEPKIAIHRIASILFGGQKSLSFRRLNKEAAYHFVQSFYALAFLRNKKTTGEIFYVSDYINEDYLVCNYSEYGKKRDVVCYNPAKGKKFSKKIVSRLKNISVIELKGMSNSQVRETLLRSKVYIDFGNHPGKDRIPREAAVSGCCVITNTKGSAAFYEDVKIPNDFKFKAKSRHIGAIVAKILLCIEDFDHQILRFGEYRKMILEEKNKFEKDVIDCYEFE